MILDKYCLEVVASTTICMGQIQRHKTSQMTTLTLAKELLQALGNNQ